MRYHVYRSADSNRQRHEGVLVASDYYVEARSPESAALRTATQFPSHYPPGQLVVVLPANNSNPGTVWLFRIEEPEPQPQPKVRVVPVT